MPEIADVVTLTTISVDWGNDIRDRTIQRYASDAARTAAHPSPTEGDLSYLNDTNRVYVYTGSAWTEQGTSDAGSAWAPVAGGAQDLASGDLTSTLTDKASVVFTKPAAWNTYALAAHGSVQAKSGAVSASPTARVEIGASNGVTNSSSLSPNITQSLFCFHSVTAQTATPVTVAVAVAELSGTDASYLASTITYIAYRLT